MRIRLAGLLALATALSALTASGVSAASGVVGHLYVNDNTTGVNTVAGFDRHADGTLTPIPGSPFAVGGTGAGKATASQGSLQLSADGRYLLAVDTGSNEISVLRIKPDGSLQIAGDGPVSSNGLDPVSIAVSGSLVYVANADPVDPNYTGFTLNSGGHLRPIPGSTVSLPAGSQPGDVLFNGDGTKLVGARVASSLIDSFTVGSDGLLTAAPGSPFPAQGQGPFGSEFRPTNASELYVSNAHDGANLGSVSAFNVSGNGTLQSIGASPVADSADTLGHATDVERSAVRALEPGTGADTSSGPAGVSARSVRRQGLGRGHAVPHDRCCISRDAAGAGALRVPRIECAHIRDVQRRAGGLLLQP